MARAALALAVLAVAVAGACAQFAPVTCPAALAAACATCESQNVTKTECKKDRKTLLVVCKNETETIYSCPTCNIGYQPSTLTKNCSGTTVSIGLCGPQCQTNFGIQLAVAIPPATCAVCDANSVQLNAFSNLQAQYNLTTASWVLSLKNATWTQADVVPLPASGPIAPFKCAQPPLVKPKAGQKAALPPLCTFLASNGKCVACPPLSAPDTTKTACLAIVA